LNEHEQLQEMKEVDSELLRKSYKETKAYCERRKGTSSKNV
jgi:hypothetical protein